MMTDRRIDAFFWVSPSPDGRDVLGRKVELAEDPLETRGILRIALLGPWRCWRGQSVAGPSFRSWATDGVAYDESHGFPTPYWDFAVLRLDQPLGSMLGTFGTKVYDDDWEDQARWFCVGYHGDRKGGNQPAIQHRIAVDEEHVSPVPNPLATAMLTSADTMPGASGGPLFGLWPAQDPYLVGCLTGNASGAEDIFSPTKDYSVFAGGFALVALVAERQAMWP